MSEQAGADDVDGGAITCVACSPPPRRSLGHHGYLGTWKGRARAGFAELANEQAAVTGAEGVFRPVSQVWRGHTYWLGGSVFGDSNAGGKDPTPTGWSR